MKKILIALAVSACFVGAAHSQNLVPTWSHGPTVSFYSVAQDANGTYHGNMLTAGAGWEIACNLVDSYNFPWLSIGNPHIIGSETSQDSFAYATGLTLKVGGNVGFGALVDLIQTQNGDGSGLFTGDFSWKKNGMLVFMVSAPFSANSAIYTVGK